MKKQNVRTLSLIVCTFTYLLVGAAVFDALESDEEKKEKLRLENEEATIRSRYNITDQDFEILRKNIRRSIPHKAGIQWKFAGAFYFATTVITTIGYGHSTPKTVGGKIFCMFYALCGIPMTLVMFQSIGERLNTFVTFILKHVKKCLKLKNTEVTQTNLIMVGVNMCTIVLTSGAAAFSIYEDWPYLDSFYYCFITLTTIGFGDFVALQKSKALQSRPDYVAFSLIFILSGLAVLSANMNLLVLRFLTLNTEDERREEMEAAVAARGAVRLEGDIIVPNGNAVQGQPQENPEYSDLASVCSCTCYNLRARASEKKHRLLSRSPGGSKGAHHVQMTSMNSNRDQDLHSCSDDVSLQFPYQYLSRKRASI